MKLTKKLEAEILKAYNTIWDAYLRGDMKTFASILDENCYIIGSAAGEVFSNKKAAVKYYKSTADQITGKVEFRNRTLIVKPAGNDFMVNEETDFYLLIDDQWTFYGPARISSLFHKKNNKWKLIHQHGSFPDSKTEEGDQVNADKIKAENIQLRDAVKRRTVELEQKNRELEIEASLEKVRAQALGMYKPDDLLDVCKVLFKELSLLGFSEIRNAIIHTLNDEENYLIDYDYSDLTGGVLTKIPYSDQSVIKRFLKQIRKSDEAFAEITVKGKELSEWKKFRKSGGQPDDPRLDKASALYYYCHSVGTSDIGISTFSSINEEKHQLLKRFRNVFDLAYKRYTDITKAEAQAREAQVELALERVRAKTMAMQKPSEFVDVINIIGEQFVHLGFDIEWANFGANGLDVVKGIDIWNFAVIPGGDPMSARVFIPYFDHPVFIKAVEGLDEYRKTGNDLFKIAFGKEDKDHWLDQFFTKTVFKDVPEEYKAIQYAKPGYTTSNLALKDTWLSIGKFDVKDFTDEQHAILRRFGSAFGQAYTRFLDLQKAEAQAKEAQIEAALERVRARTMGMHQSNDLHEVIKVVTEQLSSLGVKFNVANFAKIDLDGSWDLWLSTPEQAYPALIHVPYLDHPIFNRIIEVLTKGDDFTTDVYTREEATIFFRHFFENTIAKNTPEERKQFVYGSTGFTRSLFLTKNIWFSVSRYNTTPFTDEENAIFKRFANVFEQAYTRFLDLQKAEAQAKEAQIEVSLERVRSRAMAMQTSEELNELIGTVFTELTKLDFVLTRCVILIYEGDEKGVRWWMANSEAPSTPMNFFVKYANLPFFNNYLKGWHERSLKWEYILEGEDKIRTDNVLFNETELSLLPDFVIAGMKANSKVYLSASFNNYGCLNLASLEPLSDEHFDILLRFAKVFDLTYTRFNDLKQAEAQAKEARIEVALERVRARTMAMQKSDELAEVVGLLFKQFEQLGFELYQLLISIYDTRNNIIEWWSKGFVDIELPQRNIIPIIDHPFPNDLLDKWKNGTEYYAHTLEGEIKKSWDEYLFTQTDLKHFPQEVKDMMRSVDKVFVSDVFMKYGSIQAAGPMPLSDDKANILKRFAKVLDQSYTRMTDLQKAETQARESEIELALERVRAKSMSMRHSDELADLVKILFKELTRIGFSVNGCIIMTYDERTNDSTWWIANFDGVSNPVGLLVPNHSHEPYLAYLKEWKKQTPKWSYKLGGAEKKKWDEYIFKNSGLAALPDGVKTGMQSVKDVHLNVCFNKYASITFGSLEPMGDNDFDTLHRFAKVFEQSYTRFLDLQNAEAQTREAKIETALERVRARAMAMHTSQELKNVALELRNQMGTMAQPELEVCAIHLYDESPEYFEAWAAVRPPDSEGKIIQLQARFPKKGLRIVDEMMQQYHSGKKDYVLINEGEKVPEWFQQLKQQVPEGYEMIIQSLKGTKPEDTRTYWSVADFPGGALVMTTYIQPNEDARTLLRRFSNVFGLAYRRFVDLKQAEAQTREARIETALEKVRSRSLAMHKSDELQEVVNTVFEKLMELDVKMDSANIAIFKEGTRELDYWIASPVQKRSASFHMPYIDLSLTRDIIAARESKTDFSAMAYSFDEKNEWFDYAFKHTDFKFLSEERKQFILNAPAIMVAIAFSKHTGVQVNRYSSKLLTEGETEILKRFSKVFEQAYIRFLDLEKAEAQANEARIEIALERIRARALAMHKSDELMEVAKVLWEQMALLGQPELEASVVHLYEEDPDHIHSWRAVSIESETQLTYGHMAIPKNSCEVVREWLQKFYSDLKDYTIQISGAKQDEWYDLLFKLAPDVINSMREKKDIHDKRYYQFSKFSGGALLMVSKQEASEDVKYLQRRAAVVFDLAYRRFSDLQKAEAQARDAQIESSLERVRSKTMAMHNSQDVGDTVATMFDELVKLGIQTLRCGVGILYEGYQMELWTAKPNETGKIELFVGHLDMKIHPLLKGGYESWKDKRDSYSYELKDDDLIAYFNAINNYSDYNANYDIASLPSRIFHNLFNFNEGTLFAFSLNQLSAEYSQVFKRFAGVFGQTYRRYLDLQKAEAQAKEAKIEASLERVRAKAMAMHKSDDLHGAVKIMFEEFQKLNLNVLRCGIGILNKDSRTGSVWTTSVSDDGLAVQLSADESFDTHPLMMLIYEYWQKQEDLDYVLQGQDLIDYYSAMDASELKLPKSQLFFSDDEFQPQYYYAAMFKAGGLYSFRDKPFASEDKKIMKRFASVVNLTYNRFLDLQKAEAQAREARIEASLERVRAKAMAMHKSEDLNSAVATVFDELDKLDLGVLRCGINILDKEKRTGDIWVTSITDQGSAVQVSGDESFDIHPLLQGAFEAWLKKEDFSYLLKGDDLTQYYRAVQAENFQLPDSQMLSSEADPIATGFKQQYCFATPYGAGGLFAFRETEFPGEAKSVMKRFAGVFDLTYKRFLDLQKAEANAREAKIEAALERVRSRTMAMHKSDELAEAAAVLFKQFVELGNEPDRFSIGIIHEQTNTTDVWATDQAGSEINVRFKCDNYANTTMARMTDGWKSGDRSLVIDLQGDELRDWINYVRHVLGMPVSDEHFHGRRLHHLSFFSQGWLNFTTLEPLTVATRSLLDRFAAVFNLTYTRFTDLKKAEAQAREATIETGLERVRARTMAMHSSDDVSAATATMFTELEKLGIENFRGGIAILLQNRTQEVWSVNNLAEGKIVKAVGTFNIDDHSFWQHMYKEWQDKKEFLHHFLAGKEKEDYVKILSAAQNYLPQSLQQFPDVHFQVYFFGEGAVFTNSLQPHSEEDQQVMKRFTSVFSLTFRRYQDLKKAEAQAREAQIEAGLERVRSRTMAMFKSDELAETAVVLFKQMIGLGIEPNRLYIAIINDNSGDLEFWITDENGDKVSSRFIVNINKNISIRKMYEGWVAKKKTITIDMQGKELEDWLTYWKEEFHIQFKPGAALKRRVQNIAYFSKGFIAIASPDDQPESTINLLERFAAVFNLTYTRFSDLQQAEAQAREATIEAALERVRGKAMAMHNSKDLATTIEVFYNELGGLSLTPRRCGIGLINKETHIGELSTMSSTDDGQTIQMIGKLDLSIHPILVGVYDNWLTKTEYHPVLRGNAIKEYYQLLRPQMAFPDFPNDSVQYGYFFFFEEGGVYAWTEKELQEDELRIYRRFTSVLSLTYKRYKDLKDAEIRAHLAIKDAALDRIRADIASMRTIDDLERITPLIWNELTVLGIPFIRCGVFIMDEEQQLTHTFLSTPDGKAIAAFHLPYATPGNIQQVLSNWRNKKNYIDHWDESAFIELAGTLVTQGVLASSEQYLKTIPHGGFYLHFLPFLQGMLYVGNTTQLSDEQIELIQHVADAFSTAYARYEDFNRLEAAKKQVENTLTDLKQAQTQLVQAEKMASLGELTAGIAHEIQNPLNFVNNFSEVSKELIDEMKEELATGNEQQAMEIAGEIIQNLEKINHHGKRADAIVKSMLQHSRSSSGKKEPTDINGLADEYLRLAYHGLRAKDKSFNAKFETDFDNSIGKINIISQDIGRVLVNLINNAFYAVSERKKQNSNGYDPIVTVYTKKVNDKIEIKVKDNGNGIPQKVLDKIFQPFFTTKPTGQGTGLGLSLAYDIVTKGHGGELKVETREGEGSEFSIQLPA